MVSKQLRKQVWDIVRVKRWIVTLEFNNQISAEEVFDVFKKAGANNIYIAEKVLVGKANQ